ncbi:MAG: GNAT family N-acetyltransferase [Chloroflexi bacterium]|jgi:ribosomal-protein-alanine N-acetyltransferase|nr:GNAT family N-acetyltransferase [Chloroflexota bacterium]
MDALVTDRLRLLPLEPEALAACLRGPQAVEGALGLAACADLVSDASREAIRVKLRRMALAPPPDWPWHTSWLMILREGNLGIGLLGFKGAPSPEGVVEIGYGISEHYRSQGYTTEAVRALIAWAFAQPGCRTVFADTRADNVASQRVLTKAGLRRFGLRRGLYLWRLDRPGPEREDAQ